MNSFKLNLWAVFLLIPSCLVYAQTPTLDWVEQFGGANNEYAASIISDDFGNIYSVGFFQGTADFDPSPSVYNLSSNGMNDLYVQKLDADGNFIWAKGFGSTDFDYVSDIELDASGNLVIAGTFALMCDFDPGAGVANLTSAGGDDAFILKLDSDGNFIWVKQFAGSGSSNAQNVKIDAVGDICVVGSFSGSCDFNPGAGTFNMTPTGSSDVYILKLDASGNFVWAKKVGGTSSDVPYGLAVDASNNLFVTGRFNGSSVDFDPGAGTFLLTSAGSDDIFFLKLNSAGNFATAFRVGGISSDVGYEIAVDGVGDCYLTGRYEGTVDFNPGPGVSNLTAAGSVDAFILKTDNFGALLWAKSIGGSSYDEGAYVTIDNDGDVLVSGIFESTADLNPGGAVNNVTSVGGYDLFLIELTSSGNYSWGASFGGINDDNNLYLNVAFNDAILGHGDFDATIDFDPSAGTYNLTPSAKNSFIIKLNVCNPTGSGETISTCDSYFWSTNGLTYTSSGTYTETLTSSMGCDSIVTLDLTLHTSYSQSENTATCDSYFWPSSGLTYTSSGTYTANLTSINGCDSIITLNLTIDLSTSATQIISACDSYTWIDGNTYHSSNNSATHIVPNSVGCDSVIALNLTITNSPFASVVEDEFSINCLNTGVTYQWVDCNNGNALVTGETAQIFTPAVDGSYAVIVDDGACSDTSECIDIIGLGINQNVNVSVHVYPNPASDRIYVDAETDVEEIVILTSDGRVVYQSQNITEIEISEWAVGTYILRIRLGQENVHFVKFVKR